MSTLIKTVDQVKEYVSVNETISFESVNPYIKQAERKYILPIVGRAMYDIYAVVDYAPTENKKLVFELLKEASANLTFFLYLPLANVSLTENGISVSQGTHHKAAEWWQIRDLRRSFFDAGTSAIDEALKIMESNEADFTEWKASTGYTIFKELFVKRTDTFNRWFHISESRKTFLALRPYMLETHHQYFTSQLNAETIATINLLDKPPNTMSLELSKNDEFRVLDHLQAAMVNYTIEKALNSGTFELTANGIYQKLEEFPGYKTKPLEVAQVNRASRERLISAEEHFKKALKLIAANPVKFPDYELKKTGEFVKPYNGKGIVSF